MRFCAPRSVSPSPVRGRRRSSSTFGLPSDSETDPSSDYSESDSDSESSISSSSSSDGEPISKALTPRASKRPAVEPRYIDENVATIRLHARHHDPYEEWERQTRKDSFRSAQKEQKDKQVQLYNLQERSHVQDKQRLAAVHAQQLAEVERILAGVKIDQQRAENFVQERTRTSNILLERVEKAIKLEEDKLNAKLDAERQAQEKIRREEELKQRLHQERLKQEQDRIQKAAEDAQRQKQEEKERQEAEVKAQADRAQKDKAAEDRKNVGLSSAYEDWRQARIDLIRLKMDPMKFVKDNMRSQWGAIRRQITSRISQLTNDPIVINRVSNEIYQLAKPNSGALPSQLYSAVLSSLAKAIILQAETEVTAEKRSAIPLAQTAYNLLSSLPQFTEIMYAKLTQRVGGWCIPTALPERDYDSRPWADEAEMKKVMGFRKSANGDDVETRADFATRVAGIMRVYFHILKIQPKQPLSPMWQTTRYWMWFARVLGEPRMLPTIAGAEIMYTALDVMGDQARDIWGQQFLKMLALIYQGVTSGLGSKQAFFIGGTSPEGKAARVRVQLEIERIMKGVSGSANGGNGFGMMT
ncbi:hypothetical protein BDN72DRAFT_800509 [Pluteus cervinus]|uniref:Uncharacterized protein n=1 Tax=Pluteus cervinus TaxID=181527 RepID=A0ACD3AJS3_9AGAR|nr:hypothetical protein BDN72DRAFT_800509 [Pluteus cervinus]